MTTLNQSEKKKQKPKHDPLLALKQVGYCRAFTTPGQDTSFEEFIMFAKFFLCKQNKKLWKDPIWDEYTNEEILVEYFAHLFTIDKAQRTEFEAKTYSGTDVYGEDIYDWLDRMVAENQKEMKKKAEEMPDKISFSPEQNKDQEE